MLYDFEKDNWNEELFADPPASLRGTPFWAWNCYMTKEKAREQILLMKEMGFGGFHIHVRVGFENRYMGREYLELVEDCKEFAKENGMLCYLYDEDRYASGIAGGEVTKDVRFRSRHLLFTRTYRKEYDVSHGAFLAAQKRGEKGRGCLLATYRIAVKNGHMHWLKEGQRDENAILWYAYEEVASERPWCNDQTYVDAMNPEAIRRFLETTHEKYYEKLGDDFGSVIPSIFTDEPNIGGIRLDGETGNFAYPFTDGLPETYRETYGEDLLEVLPYLIWDHPDDPAFSHRIRRNYFDLCRKLFYKAYHQQIGDWCRAHHIAFTGHLLAEDGLFSQTSSAGEAMYQYKAYDIPGVDNLCDLREYTTLKQAQSIARQLGREGVMSEEYGVTQWDFSFQDYKLSGDWQAALGVTLRVPHLTWASMNGEAKRDYPASIGWQSPWYRQFKALEDYFARIGYCMSLGKPRVRVAILHPLEEAWNVIGAGDENTALRKRLEEAFHKRTEWLVKSGVDFDFISQSLWEEMPEWQKDGYLQVGEMTYELLLVPRPLQLRETIRQRLEELKKNGRTQVAEAEHFDESLLDVLSPYRDVQICDETGRPSWDYLYQLRSLGESELLFLAPAEKAEKTRGPFTWGRKGLLERRSVVVTIRGHYLAEELDPFTGERKEASYEQVGDTTKVFLQASWADSFLLLLSGTERKGARAGRAEGAACTAVGENGLPLEEPLAYRNTEPNVLLLDRMSYCLDGGQESAVTELLQADNQIRAALGYPLRMEEVVQPYIRTDVSRDHRLVLKAVIDSETEVANCLLAMEERAYCTVFLNGTPVDRMPVGYYVDPCLETLHLPPIRKGRNLLEIHMQYGLKSNLEWMYLLGEFGVQMGGSRTKLTGKPDRLTWGDYTRQGFPFYTGNMEYRVEIPEEGRLQIGRFSGFGVTLRQEEKEKLVAILPYETETKKGAATITLLGNRYNGFGQLHMIGDDLNWVGPDSWRTTGSSRTDSYQVKPMGILAAPVIYRTSRCPHHSSPY
ncbi:MAG: hypothetical protein K6A92_04525 [Lachnospiraceae bacterium]|nr:hypothetical protein [Lachnospiraceae bacterium]